MNARHWLSLGLAVVLASGCSKLDPLKPPAAGSSSADFRAYAAMGTSITAGWESGGLVEHHQRHSYAALFASQVGAPFTIPSVSADGRPPLLRIVSFGPPLQISNAGRTTGIATNDAQAAAFNNMAVPYAILFDAANETYYYGGLPRPTDPFEIVARHRGTILAQVVSLGPTFVSLEYGSNEVLGPATSGVGDVTPTVAQFGALLHGTLDALQAQLPLAKLALMTVPDVTSIPFFTTFPPFTQSLSTGQRVALIGPSGPLAPDDLVLLTAGPALAAGNGFPVGSYNYVNPAAPGNGTPLDDSQVLSSAEAASIKAAVDGYDTAIRNEAAARGAALVDLRGLLETAALIGLPYQGTAYGPDFITGGLFSLDGVHPTDLAHGFICNLMIDAVNAKFGTRIPHIDLTQAATATSSRLRVEGAGRKLYPVIENAPELYRRMFPRVAVPPS
ncbi:MAG: hypothetical protein E6K78_09700 [Candidatus Eisenbacteria bacterium]|uniref:SGNH/GDSL hydrolase family protein n=1 Tax=Eiseniibacteriota bacterium TaxID=2212470 RepID=A0A538TKL8_UNCEI|nr:MAG: hypothetical protein E6K78_09700 [Candidatus Eisenbacteria bacterium]